MLLSVSQKRFLSAFLFVCGLPSVTSAAAFQLWEQNAAGLGDSHAGVAAIADDASTAYYNPAGMVRIPQQEVATGAVAVATDVRFKGSIETFTLLGDDLFSNDDRIHGVAQAGIFTGIPFFHYVAPINEHVSAGVSIVSPFGLATDYGDNVFVEPYTTTTSVRTVDLSPSIAYKVSPHWSFGAGLDFEKLEGDFNSFIVVTNDIQYDDENHGTASNYGWHAGLLYQYSDKTRVGLAFHSNVRFHLKGKSKLTCARVNAPECTEIGQQLQKNDISADVTLPAFTVLSFYHRFDAPFSLLLSATHTQWQVLKKLTLENVADNMNPSAHSGQTITIPQYYHNTWYYAAGLHYFASNTLTLRTGIGYDQTPSNRTWRNLRLPDQSRIALAVGAGFKATPQLTLDVGYSHLFVKRANLGNTTEMGNIGGDENLVRVQGHVISSADLFGLQLTWRFA